MGLLELLKKYQEKHGYTITVMFPDGSGRLVSDLAEPYKEFHNFDSPRELRDWLIQQTKQNDTEDKIYL